MAEVSSSKLREVLGKISKELEDEEVAQEFEDLKNRKVTVGDILTALRDAPPEERAQIREILADEGIVVEPAGGNGGEPEPEPPKKKKKDDPKPLARRMRPGRKSGAAYDWYTDDDGNVVRSPVAVIYSGEDEPDEVEMLDPEPPADDEGDEE